MQSTRDSCQIVIKLGFSRQIFEKYSNIKLCDNTSCGSRVVPRGRADTRVGGQADMAKQIFAFYNYANTCENELMCECNYLLRVISTTLFPYSLFEKSQVEAEQSRLI